MPYAKHNFVPGHVLKASEMNAIEDGIVTNEKKIDGKLNASGHTPSKYLGTDANGNIVVKNAPSGETGNITVDATLTTPGAAADAKVTGDNIRTLRSEIPTVPTHISSFENDKGYLTPQDGGLLPNVSETNNGNAMVVRNGAWEQMSLITESSLSENLFDKTLELIHGYIQPMGPIDPENPQVPLDNPNADYAMYPVLIYMKPNTTYAFSSDYIGSGTLFNAQTGARSVFVGHSNSSSQFTPGDNCLLYTTSSNAAGYYLALNFWLKGNTDLERFAIVEGTDIASANIFEKYLDQGVKVRSSQIVGSSAENAVTPEAFGAVGDGTHDDTAAIQAAIDTDRDVHFAKNASYRITQSLIFTNKRGITLFGNNATIIHNDSRALGVTTADGAIDCVIRDLNFTSSGKTYDGIYVASISGSTYFTRCAILNCKFAGNRYGMYLGGYQIRVEGCYFSGCMWGIDDDCCNNAIFANNYFIGNERGINANIPYFSTFTNNVYHGNTYGLYLGGSESVQVGCNIIGEVFRSGSQTPSRHLYLYNARDVHVSGIFADAGASQAVGINNSTDCILTGIQTGGLVFVEGTSQRVHVSESRIGTYITDAADDIHISSSVVAQFGVRQNRNTGRYVVAKEVTVTDKFSPSTTLDGIKYGELMVGGVCFGVKPNPADMIYAGDDVIEFVPGTTSIAGIGDGTVTGAIRALAQNAGMI